MITTTVQASGVCEACQRQWAATVLIDRTPELRCICGHRHVVEFSSMGERILLCPNGLPEPSVN